jgi:FkbM family methyltransferase
MSAFIDIARFIATHPVTRDRKLQALGRLVRWQVESRLRREVIVPWIADTRLAARRGMAGATGNIYCGLHEFEDMAFLLHFLQPEDLFVDIGANIGSYTILASGVRRARTVAFEPDPVTFAALLRNVALNSLGTLVESRKCALGPQIGKIEFTVGLDTMNRVATDTIALTQTVSMDTLDRALQGKAPSLMKLDVEGFESEILRGARATLSRPQLKAIIIEDRSPVVVDVLKSAGFAEQSYDPFIRNLQAELEKGRRGNALFVRDVAFVQKRLIEVAPIRILDKRL